MGNLRPVIRKDIVEALKCLGLKAGDILMVHTSLSSIGYVCGGAQTVIEALTETVGAEGSIMMPTQSWRNLDPAEGVHWEIAEEYWDVIRENQPAYDSKLTPTSTMGAVAEMFRSWSGAVRSSHPARSFTAWGKHAADLVGEHDLSNIFGNGSPLGKLYDLGGYVLLIGVGHDKNTSLHLADCRASYPGKHTCLQYSAVMENSVRVWKEYETLYVDGEDFSEIGAAFEAEHQIRRTVLGSAELKLIEMRPLVDFAVEWIEKNRK